MPQMEIYITDDERMELFDYIANNDGMFVPDMLYNKPEAIQIHSRAEFIMCIYEQVIGFFVISSRFQAEPFRFARLGEFAQPEEKIESSEDKYYVMQQRGGPYIRFSFYRGYANDAPIKYRSTWFSHHPYFVHYDDFELYEDFPASEELKAYYKMIVKFLKSKCRQITAKNGKKYWVSKTLKVEDVL